MLMRFLSLLIISLTPVAGVAESNLVERPTLSVGDSFTYRAVDSGKELGVFTYTITAVDPGGYRLFLENVNPNIAHMVPVALSLDASRIREPRGKRSDSEWMRFPLVPGKKWKVRDRWVNAYDRDGYDELTYTVVGVDPVTTAAGTFADAVKIEATGWWNNTTAKVSGTVRQTHWYSPRAKAVVLFERTNLPEYHRSAPKLELVSFRHVSSTKNSGADEEKPNL